MRYAFRIGGRTHHVQLEEQAEGPRFIVEGDTFNPEVESVGKGRYKVTVDGEEFEFNIDGGLLHEGPHPMDLQIHRAKPVLQRAGGAARRGSGQVKPPMPGKVVEVNVAEGDEVQEGDIVVVLEAMKMQNDIKSPLAGKVSRVHVQPGTNVESTTVLVEVEADE